MRGTYTLFRLLLLGWIFPSALTEETFLTGDVGKFAQKKCTQNENQQIICEDVKEETAKSRWPVGSYVLPMSSYGCPESYLRGWREGHLSLIWRRPRSVFLERIHRSGFISDLTNIPLTWQKSGVFAQVTRNSFKIYFCYKYRHEPLLDVGVWPDGNYSIYGINNSCPDDFERNIRNITIPEVSRWQTHGYTPDMEIFMGDTTTVQITTCTKISALSTINEMFSSEYDELALFVLLKSDEGRTCLGVPNADVIEETLYIQNDIDKMLTSNSANMTSFQTSCFYKEKIIYEFTKLHFTYLFKEEYLLRQKRVISGKYKKNLKRFPAYSVYIANITKGFARTGDYFRHTAARKSSAIFFNDIFSDPYYRKSIAWTIVDLARSVLVSAVGLGFSKVLDEAKFNQARIDCTIGNEKWALFYTNAISCFASTYHDVPNNTMELLFQREMEGRFVTLFQGREFLYDGVSSIEVYTKHVVYDSSHGSCNMDLGMIGREIRDEAISATSWLPAFPPEHSRPYSSGWCADISDEEPYIQIELPATMVVEGITIYNWKSLFLLNETMQESQLVLFGVRGFSIYYRIRDQTEHFDGGENLYVDTSQPVIAPQMFWFKEKIKTDSVRIFISEPLTEDLKCLRFELHGCKITGLYEVVNRMTKFRQTDKEAVIFVNEMFEDEMPIKSLGYPLRYPSQSYIWIINLSTQHFIKLRFLDISLGCFQEDLSSSCNDTITISRDLHGTGKPRVIDYTFVPDEDSTLKVDTSVTSLVISLRTCTLSSLRCDARGFTALLKSEHVPTCFSLQEKVPWHLGLKETCHQPAMILTSMGYLGFPFRNTTEEWTIHIPLHQIHIHIFQFLVYCLVEFSPSRFKVIDFDKETTYCNFNRPPDLINSTYDILTINFYNGYDSSWYSRAEQEGFRLVYSSSRDRMEYLINDHKPYSEVKNIALGKPAIMSSAELVLHPGFDTRAIKATDGSVHHELRGGSCFLTTYEYEPWWMVDLQGIYRLEYVVLYNRMDCCEDTPTKRADGIGYFTPESHVRNVQISTGLMVNKLQSSVHICRILHKIETIDLSDIIARYLRLTVLQFTTRFSLCEVQMYGQLVHGNWGDWASWENICYCNGTRIRRRECNNPRPDYGGHYCSGPDISIRHCKQTRTCRSLDSGLFQEPTNPDDRNNTDRRLNSIEHIEISTGMAACKMELVEYACTKNYYREIFVPLHGKTARYFKIEFFDRVPIPCLKLYGQTAEYETHNSGTQCLHDQVDGGFSSWSKWSSCSSQCGHGISTRFRTCSYPTPENGGRECLGENKEIQVCFGTDTCQVCSDTIGKCYSIFSSLTAWNNARYDCISRQMQLVSIFSIEELRFIKTLLRDRRYLDGHPTSSLFNVSFYVHIGLRFVNSDKENVPVWENDAFAHFLAWKPGHPSVGSCTRMHFQSFTDDKTWESEDCESDIAEYFMCEYHRNGTNIAAWSSDVVYKRRVVNVSVTYSGKVCQRWDQQNPHPHMRIELWEAIHDNYCRDEWDNGYLWCFTKDPYTRWEACHVRNDITVERECNNDIYNTGRKNITTSGKYCLSWMASLDDRTYRIYPNLWTQGAFCRDPFNDGYSWCYVDATSEVGNISKEICETEGTHSTQGHTDDAETIYFHCDNGMALPYHFQCNGKFECKDQTDEIGCFRNYAAHQLMSAFEENQRNASNLYFNGTLVLCPTNEWISIITLCDEVIDCFDASDETGCDDLSRNTNSMLLSGRASCREDQFQCDDGDCVHVSQVCDFTTDCIDASDEYCEHDVCSSFEFRCDDGDCIRSDLRCDAVRQCVDGSDENNCDICQANAAFHCDILRCIPNRLKCDNYADCQDGTDELFCVTGEYDSCKEWWNAGYRQNGQYIIAGILVKCVFDDYLEHGEILTVIDTLDITKYSLIVGRSTDLTDDVIHLSSTNNCTQQINGVCHYSSRKVDGHYSDSCACQILITDPAHEPSGNKVAASHLESCADIMVDNRSITHYSDSYMPSFYFKHSRDARTIWRVCDLAYCDRVIFQMGPATCSDRTKADDVLDASDAFACAENGQTIPGSQKCLYDIDNAGFPLGCRDGSHLTECGHFSCRNNTVKCPGSYCLPVRFVCDGEFHCERGYDEENCGCDAPEGEVLILYEKETADELFIRRFSRQFYTPTSIIRILSFEVSTPLKSFGKDDTQILVTDRQIDQRGDTTRSPECSFKVMSKDFLISIKFSKNGTRGLIYFQNSLTSKEVADEMFTNLDDLIGDLKIYRLTQDFYSEYDSQRVVSKVTSVRVRRWKTLTVIGAEYFSALCKATLKMNCNGMFKCASSKTCIPLGQVCDGYRHCIHGDDELLCGFQCPDVCSCVGYYANCSTAGFRLSEINHIPKTTRKLDLSLNKELNSVLQQPVLDFTALSFLNLSRCDIDTLSRYAFNRLRNLQLLDISYNLITTLPNYVFSSLTKLKTLHIHGNVYLSKVYPYAFNNLFLIRDLNLANSLLSKVSANTFSGLKLKNIDLSNNRLEDLEAFSFSNLSVDTINFEGNTIKQLNKETFTGVVDLKVLRTPSFKFCCIRPNYVDENDCFPTKDEFSSCEDLMRHSALQFLLWLIGVLALLGNCLSIIYRLKIDRKRLKVGYGIFVTNLAAADLLMGVYLLIIAIADAVFRKRYIFVDDYWRGSFLCNLAGVLSTISSEASVSFLCFITLDRLLVIKFPFERKFFTTKKSVICVILAWLTSIVIAILPLVYEGYFQNKFYSRSGVCIALPLTRDRPPGWLYSILVFVVLNFLTFFLVAIGQWSIFYEMQKSTGMAAATQSSRKRDLKVARNLLLVVATDFMCWFPIGVMGTMALSGYVISGDVYAWAAVFILPINSALNPILYTLTAIIGGKDFRPSTKEHSREKKIKEIGDNSLTLHKVTRRLANVDFPSPNYWSVYRISNEEIDIPQLVMLRSAAQLAEFLDVLHCSCLGIKSLDAKTVYFRVRNGKVLGDVKVSGEPYVSVTPEDKTDDIYRLGLLLKKIIK